MTQACNECGKVYEATPADNPSNPLCPVCEHRIREYVHALAWGIGDALLAREAGKGVFGAMSDERFEAFVAARVSKFNEERVKLP